MSHHDLALNRNNDIPQSGSFPAVDYRFKILYALGIIFVVSGHCQKGGINLLYDWFPPYSFHLGLFAFSSGYFYKTTAENSLIKYCLKKIRHLLIPLYLWNFAYALLVVFLETQGFTIGVPVTLSKLLIDPITNGHQFVYNLGGWFIVPLFMVETFTALLRKVLSKLFGNDTLREVTFFIIHCALGAVGVYIASIGYHTGLWLVLTRFLFFLPFYGMGIFYKRVLEQHDKLPNLLYFGIIFFAQYIIIVLCGRVPTYTPSWCYNFVDGPFLPFIEGFLGIFMWLRIAKILEPIIGRSKVINLIADNTFSITINHYAGFLLVNTFFAFLSRFTSFCSSFDWDRYKHDYSYLYLPKNIPQTLILYLVVAIAFPILLQRLLDMLKKKLHFPKSFSKTL